MSDPYSNLANQDDAVQMLIADAMDARCLDPAQVSIRKQYLSCLELPDNAFAVEFGSGTGYVTNELVSIAGATRALGIEPSPVMVERAKQNFSAEPALSFKMGDAKHTELENNSVDLVLMHTLLCHVPGPEEVIAEAFRVLKPGGTLAICDGDYDTATAKISDYDPLDQIEGFMINQNVTNLWIMRQITSLLVKAGFQLGEREGHGYVAQGDAKYFLTVIERGADKMVENGALFPATGEALKNEAHHRVAADKFFGFMSYVSQIATKP